MLSTTNAEPDYIWALVIIFLALFSLIASVMQIYPKPSKIEIYCNGENINSQQFPNKLENNLKTHPLTKTPDPKQELLQKPSQPIPELMPNNTKTSEKKKNDLNHQTKTSN